MHEELYLSASLSERVFLQLETFITFKKDPEQIVWEGPPLCPRDMLIAHKILSLPLASSKWCPTSTKNV
jgi:hypothetical protein